MQIRSTSPDDIGDLKALYLSAFPADEAETVASLATELFAETTVPKIFSFVAEIDSAIVGHVSCSPVFNDHAEPFLGYILAPLAVHPNHQKRGLGTGLIDRGVRQLMEHDADVLFVYGDPEYYGRFGFHVDTATAYVPPYPLQFPQGWQSKTLTKDRSFATSGNLTCVAPLQRPDIW